MNPLPRPAFIDSCPWALCWVLGAKDCNGHACLKGHSQHLRPFTSPKGSDKVIQGQEAGRKQMPSIMPGMAFWADLGSSAQGILESILAPTEGKVTGRRSHCSILGKGCLRWKSL